MSISFIMTGLGIVALVGIVVRNGILIVEFIDTLKERGMKTREAIIQAGKTRITPVILTATATILGLVPLAIGFNLNFATLFTHLDPQIHIGGDNVMSVSYTHLDVYKRQQPVYQLVAGNSMAMVYADVRKATALLYTWP